MSKSDSPSEGRLTTRAVRCNHRWGTPARCYRVTYDSSGLCVQHRPGRDSLGRVIQ